jgi:predicted DNA-binding transcriptional regulator YafY
MKQDSKTPERTLNKKMLERLIIIHNAIKAGMYPDLQKLRKLYCEQTGYSKVGEATIYRDIDMLRTYFHAPLEFDREKDGYYYMDVNWDFALNSISTEDVFYLSAAKTLLSSFEGSPIYDSISEVINFITDTQGIGKSSLLKRIAVPPVPKVNIDEHIWKKLLEAIRNNLIVEFDYNGRWNTETTHRKVSPYQFLFDDGSCFLFGYSFERDAERIFSLSRIKNLKLTNEYFELSDDFDFSTRCGGGKFGAFITEDTYDFIIDFYNDSRAFVNECIWADNQKISELEDKTRIEFSSTQVMPIMEWILSQGDNAVPVSPEWFVNDWKQNVEAMMKRVNGISKTSITHKI